MKWFIPAVLVIFVALLFVTYYVDEENSIHQGGIGGSRPTLADNDMLLPDLEVSPPQELYIETAPGVRNIRFSTTFANRGNGPLEVAGDPNPEQDVTHATQKIAKTDGTVETREVGDYILHPDHEHWHIGDYTQFQLWTYDESGEREELVATTDKMSFCLWDEEEADVPITPDERRYTNCENDIQGISPGWSDTYEAQVEGQELDIQGVPDGQYLILSIINPDRTILESNYENNHVTQYVELSGNVITVMEDQ